MVNTGSYKALIEKLNAFILKYYKHRIIRGLIYAIALLVATFVMVSLLEYIGHFNSTIRTILYFGYITSTLVIIYRFIVVPLAHLFKIGKVISYEQAAEIISLHFPEIKDKLINALQLEKLGKNPGVDIEYLRAAIEQKSKSLQHISFAEAVKSSENKRRIPLAIIPLSILILLLFLAPSVIREPAIRITNYNLHFEKPMPFTFSVLNESLSAMQGEDFEIFIKVTGSQLPAEVYVESSKSRYKAVKIDPNNYSYRFRNLQHQIIFTLNGSGFISREYKVEVYPKPTILSFKAALDYPAYTRRMDETLSNTGDFTIPDGTQITWQFSGKDCESLALITSIKPNPELETTGKNTFVFRHYARETFNYMVKPVNRFTTHADSIIHFVNVIPDRYPEIQIETYEDQENNRQLFFTGIIRDDYGFNRLIFHYIKRNNLSGNDSNDKKSTEIDFDKSLNSQTFYFGYDFSQLQLEPGDRVEYYFEVYDNDQVNGNKSSRTSLGLIEMPLREQIEEQATTKSDELNTELLSLVKALRNLRPQINKLQRTIIEKESIGWEESQRLQDLLDKQNNIQERIEKLSKGNQELNRMQSDLNKYDESVINKQQELQKLFNEIMTDEVKKLFEEIQKMLKELDMEKMLETIKKIDVSNEDLLKSLDRTKELFKQLEMEKKITDAVDKLRDLAEKQKKLAEESKQNKNEKEEALRKQEKVLEEFSKVQKDLDEIKAKNEDLEQKYNMIDTKKKETLINQKIDAGKQQIQKGNSPAAAPHQKEAGENMEDLANELTEMMMQMQSEQLGEDIQMLRKLLENLLEISFSQETLIDKTLRINRMDPAFNKILDEQKRLKDNLRIVEDSLNAIAKRQFSVEKFILKEIATINDNVQQSLDALEARDLNGAATRQQFIMTSVNNLALMLSEAMDQMMQQLAQCQAGGGSCSKPGKGKPSLSNMRDMQQQLNQQLQNMKEGKQNQGKQSQAGQSMSEQFARMAAQQEALRRQLQNHLEELRNETGMGDSGLSETIREMEQTENELVNKTITNETLLRQQRIETRLLESERAQMEREKEERRESREAQSYPTRAPDSILEFYRKKMQEREMLRTVPPQLNTYYRNLVNEYFIKIQ